MREGGRALDVGSGSGYLTTCMALMLGANGVAVGIEHMPELQEKAKRNIQADHPELLNNGRIELVGLFKENMFFEYNLPMLSLLYNGI